MTTRSLQTDSLGSGLADPPQTSSCSSQDYQDALTEGLDTLVVALDIAGDFDRVWHAGLVKKLPVKGIQGDLLKLHEDYLQRRTLQVVVNGQASTPSHIQASFPPGSVLGTALKNLYLKAFSVSYQQ